MSYTRPFAFCIFVGRTDSEMDINTVVDQDRDVILKAF